jgi:RNA polymerase sigma factor (sigma-70 family)
LKSNSYLAGDPSTNLDLVDGTRLSLVEDFQRGAACVKEHGVTAIVLPNSELLESESVSEEGCCVIKVLHRQHQSHFVGCHSSSNLLARVNIHVTSAGFLTSMLCMGQMGEHELLAERFEANRTHLRAVAYRMLGSLSEADDAVQEAWIRLSRAGTSGVDNLGGWLTTIVARVCLDMLRSRKSRREESLGAQLPDTIVSHEDGIDPEHEALQADSVGLALLVVLETLAPAERLAFVLHDMFAVPFDEIAPIVGKSPAAARQLASRARRRVQGAAEAPKTDRVRQREVVNAFLAASREGNFDALLALLDPDVVLRADQAAVGMGASKEVRGAAAVAGTFSGRARTAQPALVNGAVGVVWAPGGRPRVVFDFTISRGKIVGIEQIADPERLEQLDLAILND